MRIKMAAFFSVGILHIAAGAATPCEEIESGVAKKSVQPHKLKAMKTWTLPILSSKSTLCRKNGACLIAADAEAAKKNLSKGRLFGYSTSGVANPSEVNLESGAPANGCLNGTADGKNCHDACRSVTLPSSMKSKPGQVVFIPALKGKSCGGKIHDGCVVVSDVTSRPEGIIFMGRCLKIGRHDGLCNDDDIQANERALNAIKSFDVYPVSDELGSKFVKELDMERRKQVSEAYGGAAPSKAKDRIPVMPAEAPEAGR